MADLTTLASFVNTADLNAGSDALADVEGLTRWAAEHGFASRFDEADRRRAVAFREALRRVLLDRHDRQGIAALDDHARGVRLRVSFEADGSARLEPAEGGLIAGLLAIVARAQADGTWSRMKACVADDCHWAFYDRSRNRSRTWCSMSECGNRAKARSYRGRQR